jgi:hypothetical protein
LKSKPSNKPAETGSLLPASVGTLHSYSCENLKSNIKTAVEVIEAMI